MKTLSHIFLHQYRLLFVACLLCLASIPGAMAQDIDLNNFLPEHEFTFNLNGPVNETIGLVGPVIGANAFWEFGTIPPGATTTVVDGFITSFTHQGITVTLPPGVSESNPVPQTDDATVTGSPTATPSFTFSITVADEDGVPSQTRSYSVFINQPMDLVMVFDRSGSMNTTTGAGISRWNALKEAAANFGNTYQNTGRTDDRLSITYFETDLVPASACCDAFINFNNTIGSTINTDLNANSPAGWTAMGAGLKNAETKLSASPHARSILIFTDGEQNQDPEVNTNGLGYSDGSSVPSNVNIFTIGIGDPSGDYNLTLQNLALQHNGSYNTTEDGSAFTFKTSAGGDVRGDLSSGFTEAFVAMLSGNSPQLIDRSTTNVSSGAAPHTLQTFPLNKKVDKLLLEFVFDRKFEVPELVQLLGAIMVTKDGTSVMPHVKPSWVGNYTNTLLLAITFNAPGLPPLAPEGNWTVQLNDVSNKKINYCNLTTIADDHRLHIKRVHENKAPKVNDSLPITLTLDWLSIPVTDATVEAIVLRPGEDLGDILATNPLTVDVSDAQDAGSPGTQKYNELWATDSAFRALLERTENLVTLNHTADGKYEGTFNGLTVAGVYKILFRISGTHADIGNYQRIMSESFYTTFSSVDLAQSEISKQIVNGKLILKIRPKTSYGKFVGPAMGSAFAVSTAAVKIDDITDHQDGRYTITFSGDVDADVTLSLLGQDIYKGELSGIGDSGSFLDWVKSLGWPVWLVLLLILILIIWLIIKKK